MSQNENVGAGSPTKNQVPPIEIKAESKADSAPVIKNPVYSPRAVGQPGELMDFPAAIAKIIGGAKVARQEWPQNTYCLIHEGLLAIFTNGEMHQWIVSDGDLLSTDWFVL